jgi:hypothetical protein
VQRGKEGLGLSSQRCSSALVDYAQLPCGGRDQVIIWRSCRPCRAMSTLSAPSRSLNFSTDSVATLATLSFQLRVHEHAMHFMEPIEEVPFL